jgi:hypothetical protein
MVDMTWQGLTAQPGESSEPKALVTGRVLGLYGIDEPQRLVGLGWEPMSQSAARLRLPA